MRAIRRPSSCNAAFNLEQRRAFHDYFVTHLPSSSLHPDSRPALGPNHHKLPRAASSPHGHDSSQRTPSSIASAGAAAAQRNTTVVRIPLRKANFHFGGTTDRGARPYNEDTWQAGTIEIPAFAKRQPLSISRRPSSEGAQQAQSASGDPQVFYFGVFDGHGGEECSAFLRDRLHAYLEDTAEKFALKSSLRDTSADTDSDTEADERVSGLEQWLVQSWRDTVGGYFKRFRPEYFLALPEKDASPDNATVQESKDSNAQLRSLEAMLNFAFLHADLDFTKAQAQKETATEKDDPVLDDKPLNDNDVLSHDLKPASQNLTTLLSAPIGGLKRFPGGSTCSVALVSTPTPMPFWNPASPSTVTVAHVGDTRILLCRVSDGAAVPLTTDHHPSAPVEADRLRRFAGSFVTDSFGEERLMGLANTRSFGDVASKRMGVSAEPQITTMQLAPGEYSFMTLMSDGVSATFSDQEVVDIIKEARTPEQACKDVVSFATEISSDADNATCLVIRLGGWERRGEGGGGSLGTREQRQFRREDALNPRSRRQ